MIITMRIPTDLPLSDVLLCFGAALLVRALLAEWSCTWPHGRGLRWLIGSRRAPGQRCRAAAGRDSLARSVAMERLNK